MKGTDNKETPTKVKILVNMKGIRGQEVRHKKDEQHDVAFPLPLMHQQEHGYGGDELQHVIAAPVLRVAHHNACRAD